MRVVQGALRSPALSIAVCVLMYTSVMQSSTLANSVPVLASSGHVHIELDGRPGHHARQHATGLAALEWLHNTTAVIPRPASSDWPDNLVVGYAAGYDFEILKPLIYSFLENVEEPAKLVLLSTQDTIDGMPQELLSRVVVQKHEMPSHLHTEDLPYAVSLRFFVTVAFLTAIRHSGTVFFLDTRDVFLQRDPFHEFSDGLLHFPKESSSYRLKGPFTDNGLWLRKCYGEETMTAIGGMYVLNSGTLIGPSHMLVHYFELMLEEFRRRWHCMRLHGSDQAVHNYMVYTGRLISTGLQFQLEDQVAGRFAFVAYTHPEVWDFRYLNEAREELFNRQGDAIVAIHLWPGDNRVANKVVWPFVAEIDERIRNAQAVNSQALADSAH